MSIDLKQDILNAVRKGNCPYYKDNSHACWSCAYSYHITEMQNGTYITVDYGCGNTEYDTKTYKVKPRKITRSAFCEHCGKKVQFYLDWMGCAWPTDKGIVTYRELEAHCPHCYREIYVPAVNDVNVYRRNKAYAKKVPEPLIMPIASGEVAKAIEKMMQMRPSEETERGKEILKEMFEGKEK